MKRIFLTFIGGFLSLVLCGCGQTLKVVDEAGRINDQALLSAEFIICRGASVGSVRRNFGSQERAELWRKLCTSYGQEDNFTPETSRGE